MFSVGKHLKESGEAFAANWMMGFVAGLLGLIPIAGSVVLTSWQAVVGRSKAHGESAELQHLLEMDQAMERAQPGFALFVASLLVGGVSAFLGTIGAVIALGSSIGLFFFAGAAGFATGLMADRPGLSFLDAMRTVGVVAKGNPTEMFKLLVATGAVAFVGAPLCAVGLVVTLPIAAGALYLAGREANVEIETAAASAGIELR
jgi:hypothetical protein